MVATDTFCNWWSKKRIIRSLRISHLGHNNFACDFFPLNWRKETRNRPFATRVPVQKSWPPCPWNFCSLFNLKEEDLLDLITVLLKVKSMSTRGPGRGDTCHLTDFSETWPDWRTYPITQGAKTVMKLQFSGGELHHPLLFLHKFFEKLH